MTNLFFTIDTEYESGFTAKHGRDTRQANFDRSIAGRTADGEAGIFYQMDVFEERGMKAVFFVDPMPALLWGTGAIADIVEPVVARGHDVQLHLHTEWLAFADAGQSPVPHAGPNIKDYSQDQQQVLLEWGRDQLMAAGAPRPTVFRAGNYGANDDTLRALGKAGFTHDSSHAPAVVDSACEISLTAHDRAPIRHKGVTEIPVSCIGDPDLGMRHGQLTALSVSEMHNMLRQSFASGYPDVTLVSHSFELLSRNRQRVNRILQSRFEGFCKRVQQNDSVEAVTYREALPQA